MLLVAGTDFQRSYTYDMLGRRLTYTEDQLSETYYYNGENMEQKTIAWNEAEIGTQQEIIDYIYSNNRLTEIHSSEYANQPVYYTYDKGRVEFIEDESGMQYFSYGDMGEVTKMTRVYVLPNTNQQSISIETNFAYDSWGRIDSMIYPDGEILKYAYDYGGQLKSITGTKAGNQYTYLDTVFYNMFGAKTTETYGNGIQASFSYNINNQRLTQLQYQKPATSETYMQASYNYDLKGNITQINTTYSGTYPQTFNQTFSYDVSDQLEQASGNSGNIYDLNVTYNNYGRINSYDISQTDPQTSITQQQNTSFTYPTNITSTSFAPESANNGSITYEFGINGSLRKRADAQKTEYYLFNSFGNMKSYSEDGATYGYYGYDVGG